MPVSSFLRVVLFTLAGSLSATAQITDTFSDGDITENPTWTGDLAHFTVNSGNTLQLLAPGAGTSMLAVGGAIPDSAVWRLDVRLDFAPSGANQLRIYLQADQPDLTLASGYMLEIGESGNADALRLFRQDAGARSLLGVGAPGAVASEPLDIRLRVVRRADGLWTVYVSEAGGPFTWQISATDTLYGGGPRWFGLFCQYTATRTDKFFFDNLDIQPDLPDTQPPVLLAATALGGDAVRAAFSEPLHAATAIEPTRYAISGMPGTPLAVELSADAQSVILNLPEALPTGDHTLTCTGIRDTIGNTAGVQTAPFSYLQVGVAETGDILINEIMADPTPSAGLPEAEWLELYNRSDHMLALETLRISDGGTAQALPAGLLAPDSFVVLCGSAAADLMAGIAGNVRAVSGFPGLNNDGEELILSRLDGIVIDRVAYASDWHTESGKEEGGWALERVHPDIACGGPENWRSCTTLPGGTPGRRNAAYSLAVPETFPRLLSVYPVSPLEIHLEFSRAMDPVRLGMAGSYRTDPPLTLDSAEAVSENRARLFLSAPVVPGQLYRLWIADTVVDCYGMPALIRDTVLFAWPDTPVPGDIAINEVLFNPASGGSRFVELYNTTDHVFDFSSLYLANLSQSSSVRPIRAGGLFLPGMYAVCAGNTADIQTRFQDVRTEWLFPVDLPSLPDDAGHLALVYTHGAHSVIIDSFNYRDDYHNPFLAGGDREGVSLERLRVDLPAADASNWTSAAGPPGGPAGTPTRPNSQRFTGASAGADWLEVSSVRLSPDDDGYEDYLVMSYQLPHPGFSGKVVVYDVSGITVRNLATGVLAGTHGFLRWDGDAQDGSRLRPGIYILFAEFLSPDGKVLRAKKPVALTGRF